MYREAAGRHPVSPRTASPLLLSLRQPYPLLALSVTMNDELLMGLSSKRD
jgi:hypothetical protein